jgi:hypothetical protein
MLRNARACETQKHETAHGLRTERAIAHSHNQIPHNEYPDYIQIDILNR